MLIDEGQQQDEHWIDFVSDRFLSLSHQSDYITMDMYYVYMYSMYHFTDLITMLHNMPCNLCISKASDRFALWRGEKKETLRTFIASI
jgi:hypothetical protein